MSYAIGSKEHFQNIFSRIDIDQHENPELKIEQLSNEIDLLKRSHKLEYNNLLTFHKFEIDELRKKLEESDKHNKWLEEELEVLETGKTREELFG